MYKDNAIEQKLAERIFIERLHECEKFPKYFQIEPTDRCNAKCKMCSKSVTESVHNSSMSEELFNKICEELEEYSDWIEMITIQWMGEPLLDRELELKIQKLKKIGIKKVSLSTNVSLLNEERCQSLLESGLDDLRMSIDSVKKSTYEAIRCGLDFDKVIKNAMKAISIRDRIRPDVTIRVRMVDMCETHDEIEEWLEFWNPILKNADFAQVMPSLSKWEDKRIDNPYQEVEPCISLFSTMIISSEGKVALCCIDSELQEVMGDINTSTIKSIWNSEKFEKYRDLHLDMKRNSIDLCNGCNCWNRYK